MEFHDDMPVTGYEVSFAGRSEVGQEFGEKLYKGHVVVFVVAGVVDHGTATYVTRKDFEDERIRRYKLNLETSVPLTGTMRDQAVLYLSYGGDEGEIDFASPSDSMLAVDRLRAYMVKSWPAQLPEDLDAESLAKAVIEQMENYRNGVVPRPEATEVAPNAEAPVQPDEPEPTRPDDDVPQGGELADPPEVEASPAAAENMTVPAAPMAVEDLKALMGEEDEPRATGLKLAKLDYNDDELDSDGFPITVMDEKQVHGSVYGPGHSGANQRIIDQAVGV